MLACRDALTVGDLPAGAGGAGGLDSGLPEYAAVVRRERWGYGKNAITAKAYVQAPSRFIRADYCNGMNFRLVTVSPFP